MAVLPFGVVSKNQGSLGRQRQADLCEFEAGLVHREVPGQPGIHREILSQKQTKKKASRFRQELGLS